MRKSEDLGPFDTAPEAWAMLPTSIHATMTRQNSKSFQRHSDPQQ